MNYLNLCMKANEVTKFSYWFKDPSDGVFKQVEEVNAETAPLISLIRVEDCVITFKNFSGTKSSYNDDRTFSLVLPLSEVENLKTLGFNIKEKAFGNEEEGEVMRHINVKVNMDSKYPPIITLFSTSPDGGKHRKTLTNETVDILDRAAIENVSIEFNAYRTEVRKQKTTSAYLSKLFAVQVQTPEADFGGRYSEYIDNDNDVKDDYSD